MAKEIVDDAGSVTGGFFLIYNPRWLRAVMGITAARGRTVCFGDAVCTGFYAVADCPALCGLF
jgi:hypothetical protein